MSTNHKNPIVDIFGPPLIVLTYQKRGNPKILFQYNAFTSVLLSLRIKFQGWSFNRLELIDNKAASAPQQYPTKKSPSPCRYIGLGAFWAVFTEILNLGFFWSHTVADFFSLIDVQISRPIRYREVFRLGYSATCIPMSEHNYTTKYDCQTTHFSKIGGFFTYTLPVSCFLAYQPAPTNPL